MDKKKILLVSLGHLSCDINGGALPAVLPFLRSAYGLSYQATGGLMFAYSCLSSLIQPLFGLLADRFSKPWFIPLGVLLAGGGLALVGFMTGYWAIFCAIVVSGVGAALFHPEGARFANKVSGRQKGTGLSRFSIGGNSGFVLGPLLATAVLSVFGLHGTAIFAAIALTMASLLLTLIWRMRAPAGEGGGAIVAEAPGVNNWPEFSKLTMAIVARSILFAGFNTFVPLYWVNVLGQSRTAGALALTFFCTCGVNSNFFGGLLSDKYGYRTIIRLAYALVAPVVLAFSLADNVYAAWAVLPFLGFTLYAPFSSLVVLGQQYLAKNIGFASGVTLGLATSLGGVMAPLLAG
jgi:FSR family fosmidomycin resistance protein-like MFS transporter